jgi:hypothetical protein
MARNFPVRLTKGKNPVKMRAQVSHPTRKRYYATAAIFAQFQ